MREAIPSLPKYAFVAWCLVKRSIGTLIYVLYSYIHVIIVIKCDYEIVGA
jgi:hypothetical protein